MDYISTRDTTKTPHRFTDILLSGLAPDGGLYVPVAYPRITEEKLTEWRAVLAEGGYPALAAEVVKLFVSDIPPAKVEQLTAAAYRTPVFSTEEIVPVTALEDGIYLAHLSEGPTAAFKDMAMQLLGELFEFELARREETLNILGATSGDTGSSAEYAMRGRGNINVFMLTPAGRMTPFQQAQMFGLNEPNIFNIALDGVFDDCQDVVKEVNSDATFKSKHHIGAVNSINWARLLAQIIYYISSYIKLTSPPAPGEQPQQVSFCVPTGNFGDICAGHIAKQMGLPIDKLIVATNENDVLHEFFISGQYRPRSSAETQATSSPSMDISRASNFERFIFDVLERDATKTKDLFGVQVKAGGFELEGQIMEEIRGKYGFLSGRSTHADRISTIRDTHANQSTLIDPHTADGVFVARGLKDQVDTPIVVLETALPVKFSETIVEATGQKPDVPERFAGIMEADRHVVDMPNDAEAVKEYIASIVDNGSTGK